MKIPQDFGRLVFGEREMKERLKAKTFEAIKSYGYGSSMLDAEIADEVAEAMKIWAMSLGATHYTHWFQPMTGLTAEKHDAFLSRDSSGTLIMEFRGRELIKGEPDASSFPSGGMRDTCEARGYTAWDASSPAFVVGTTLYIPSCFISYSGDILDKKTPLLRSMEVIDKAATRLVNLLGIKANSTMVTVGAEQEYFLIDRKMLEARKDIKYTGRTLFGAAPPKGQELEDQYFGSIRPRVLKYMEDIDSQLWELGIPIKTRHNETAPAQHELAQIFESLNVAVDHNLLTMDIMKRTAERHGFAILLHEKPFKGVNGSGKHNNWSLATDTGVNIFSPGNNPPENLVFLTFTAALIRAVDMHSDLLRLSVATASNEHRLGANEAPPAIISLYLGNDLSAVFDAIENGTEYKGNVGVKTAIKVSSVADFEKDTSDRNRTSPFAFTGNKFEFRALGSSLNIACPNTMLNVIVSESLDYFYDKLKGEKDVVSAARKIIAEIYRSHKRIVFNGNNYSSEWTDDESKKRGLEEIKSTPEALCRYSDEKNVALFNKYDIFTRRECVARREILLGQYAKVINIEAHTMFKMVAREFLPACVEFMNLLGKSVNNKKLLGMPYDYEGSVLFKISNLVDKAYMLNNNLEEKRKKAAAMTSLSDQSKFLHDKVLSAMDELRGIIDDLELLVGREFWPLPSYGDLFYYI